ncbi:hypothetical protein NKI79_12580 [Mesorhizobium sp. M0340]|uniref:hypothetical protein n=1 Tax=Mesorhizobium sp. M0340 TaxID=2956939 RepID=UPI003334CBA8
MTPVPVSDFIGTMTLSFVGVLAYRWFGPVALIVVAGIGLPALLAFSAYRFDLKTRHKPK